MLVFLLWFVFTGAAVRDLSATVQEPSHTGLAVGVGGTVNQELISNTSIEVNDSISNLVLHHTTAQRTGSIADVNGSDRLWNNVEVYKVHARSRAPAHGSEGPELIPNEGFTENASISSHVHTTTVIHMWSNATAHGSDSFGNDVEVYKVQARSQRSPRGSEGPEVFHVSSALQTNPIVTSARDVNANRGRIFCMVVCALLTFCCLLPCTFICIGNRRATKLRAELVKDGSVFPIQNKREFVPCVSSPIDRISQESSLRIHPFSEQPFRYLGIYSGEKSDQEVVFYARVQLPLTLSVGIPRRNQCKGEDRLNNTLQKSEAPSSSSLAVISTPESQIVEAAPEMEGKAVTSGTDSQIVEAALEMEGEASIKYILNKLKERQAHQSLIDRGLAELERRGHDFADSATMRGLAGPDFDIYMDKPFINISVEKVVRGGYCFQTPMQLAVFDAGSQDQKQIGLITRLASLHTMRFEIRTGASACEDSPPSLVVQGPAWQSACISSCLKMFLCVENGVLEILQVVDGGDQRVGFITKKSFEGDAEHTSGSCYLSFGGLTDQTCKVMLLATALFINCCIFST